MWLRESTASGRDVVQTRPAAGLIVVTALLTVAAFVLRLLVLFQDEAPRGLDGYYYAVQLRSLLETGRLYYPGMPLAFWLLAPFAALTNPIVGTKIGAAFFASLAIPAIVLIVHTITRDVAYAALGGVIAATSAQSIPLSTEFVKQGVGLTLALTLLAVAARAHKPRHWIIAGILGVACVATHGTSAVLAVWFVAPIVVARTHGKARVTFLAGLALVAAAFLWRYRTLILEMGDIQSRVEAPLATRLVALILVLLGVAGYVRRADGLRWMAILAGPATFAIVLNLPVFERATAAGLAPRLQLLSFVSLALCFPVALYLLARRALVAIVVIVAVLPFALTSFREAARIRYEPPEQLTLEIVKLRGLLPSDAVLIAQEHSTAFQVKWLTGVETVSTEPRSIDPSRTWRLLSIGIPHRIKERLLSFEKASPNRGLKVIRTSAVPRHFTLVVVPEAAWRAFVASLPPDLRATVDPWPTRASQ
jgi:hypothetical protein